MEQYLESLSVTEAEKLKKTILSLFRQTCILQENMTRLHWFQVTTSSLQYAEHIATLLKAIFRFSDVNCCMIHRSVFSGS